MNGKNLSRVGFMQGRLSPPQPGMIQSFPWETWRDEFKWGIQNNFCFLEWVFESNQYEENPLWSQDGRKAIRETVSSTGLKVESVVGDCFMTHPLFRGSRAERNLAQDILKGLVDACAEVGIGILEIPMLENSSLETPEEEDRLFECLARVRREIGSEALHFSLEMNLPPIKMKTLIERFSPQGAGVTFDMGNSAALGYDPEEEIPLLAPFLTSVHVKDRLRNGGTVPLGQGDVQLARVFQLLEKSGYSGNYILQTARTPGRDIEVACGYRDQVAAFLDRAGTLSVKT